jgi:adenine-specific DNA methylase
MAWDSAEAVPLSQSAGSWGDRVTDTAGTIEAFFSWTNAAIRHGQVSQADAARHPLPDDPAHIGFTDPPYCDAVPYADLSDFFWCG